MLVPPFSSGNDARGCYVYIQVCIRKGERKGAFAAFVMMMLLLLLGLRRRVFHTLFDDAGGSRKGEKNRAKERQHYAQLLSHSGLFLFFHPDFYI